MTCLQAKAVSKGSVFVLAAKECVVATRLPLAPAVPARLGAPLAPQCRLMGD